MQFQNRLVITFAILACGFFFIQPVDAQETFPLRLVEDDSETNDSDDDKKHPAPPSNHTAARVTADGMHLPDPDESLSLALVPSSNEAEELVIVGFEIKPPDYPALPPVEGTRINSGKKTSFAKPDEFPTITNNNFREAMATTPGIVVSEEPSSPIVNFGYRGLDSQRSEAMQILKDGVSIKNEQFGFPETHYAPILDAVEHVRTLTGLPIGTALDADADVLSSGTATVVLRVVQEALQNVHKHAAASSASVATRIEGRDWVVEVRDDGRGFDPVAVAAHGRRNYGLQFMRERAELIGARLDVRSRPDGGTVVRLAIPTPG